MPPPFGLWSPSRWILIEASPSSVCATCELRILHDFEPFSRVNRQLGEQAQARTPPTPQPTVAGVVLRHRGVHFPNIDCPTLNALVDGLGATKRLHSVSPFWSTRVIPIWLHETPNWSRSGGALHLFRELDERHHNGATTLADIQHVTHKTDPNRAPSKRDRQEQRTLSGTTWTRNTP